MKGNQLNFLLLLFILSFWVVSCNNSDDEELEGNWSEESDFDGVPRGDAVSFVIGNYGYVGTGYDGDDRLNDFWQYDPTTNNWLKMADFPGAARNGAVAFSINGKGYIGTGYDGNDELSDFYQYTPETDSWTKIADFPGSARYGAVAFAVGGKGYVGTGYDGNYLKDFYAYTPETDSWEQVYSIGGSKRRDATAFVINDKAYVVSGLDNGSYLTDLWTYDQSSGLWSELREITDDNDDEDYDNDYTGIARINAVALTIGGKAYLVGGTSGSILETTWEYNPQTDLWAERTSFEGVSRTEAVGLSIGLSGYVATGRSSSYYFDDIWSFDPSAEYDEDN
ncbi:MAG: Kelch repeat-containing protein [Draconibacterium sp.]